MENDKSHLALQSSSTTELLDQFQQVVVVDFEFQFKEGNLPTNIECMVFKDLKAGTTSKLWMDELIKNTQPPFSISEKSCVIAFQCTKVLSCFISLGWNFPQNIIDLRTEFLNNTNGLGRPLNTDLSGVVKALGIKSVIEDHRESRFSFTSDNIICSESDRKRILGQCEAGTIALEMLLPKILEHPFFNLEPALRRGKYLRSLAKIEANGIPIDTITFNLVRQSWDGTKASIIRTVDKDFRVFKNSKFKKDLFGKYLKSNGINNWPKTQTGQLEIQQETFKSMAQIYPKLEPLWRLRKFITTVNLENLVIGDDNRNRVNSWPFASKTGRNQPSSNKNILGLPRWARSFIKPEPNTSIAYIDWCHQEFGIAAALSGDSRMKSIYLSTDPYLQFAKESGYVPFTATKESHPKERELFKIVMLAVQYQMTDIGLSRKLNISRNEANALLDLHRRTFTQFWEWSDDVVARAYSDRKISSLFGWCQHISNETNERSIRNFPMQANGAEILRAATCLLEENGIKICATLHDAILIEAPTLFIAEKIRVAEHLMAQASSSVLSGFELKTEANKFNYPDRYSSLTDTRVWDLVMNTINDPTNYP